MRQSVVFGAVAALLCAGFISAANAANSNMPVVQDKKSCLQAVADAREARAVASVSDKAKGEVDNLIQVSDHLCTQANFVFAEKLLAIARGMVAQE